MGGRSEHAETPGAADRGDHVAAMAEGQQRKFNSQHVADRRFHDSVYSLGRPFWLCSCCLNFPNSEMTLAHHGQPSQALDTDPALAVIIRTADDQYAAGIPA